MPTLTYFESTPEQEVFTNDFIKELKQYNLIPDSFADDNDYRERKLITKAVLKAIAIDIIR